MADYEDSDEKVKEEKKKQRRGGIRVRLSPMQNMCAVAFLAPLQRLRLFSFSLFVD